MSSPDHVFQAQSPQGTVASPPLGTTADARPNGHTAECPICYEVYREAASLQAPKRLRCFHSVCLACLRKLACQDRAFPFVVCPFCRTVTAVPDGGLQALEDDQVLLGQVAPAPGAVRLSVETEEDPGDGKGPQGASRWPPGYSARPLDSNYQGPNSSVFTVSGFVPEYSRLLRSVMGIWGMLHLQEVRAAVVVEVPSRDGLTPKSVENLRLGFAVALILLTVSVFFTLVFLK